MTNSSKRSTSRKALQKPKKPRPDFPLFPHASGKWCKTIRGKSYYFGTWNDPSSAEQEYLDVASDLHAGRSPSSEKNGDAGVALRECCNAFIRSKRTKMEGGNLSPRTFMGYDKICRLLIQEFGANRSISDLGPADFEKLFAVMSKKFGVLAIGTQITIARSVFKYAYETDLLEKPIKFSPTFKAPSKGDIRKFKAKAKHKNGSKTFTAAEIRLILDEADLQLRAMVLLGINCGFGNTDCANLPQTAIDFDNGWIDFPRVKTGAERKIPLWPETIAALKETIANRKDAANPDDEHLVFITKYGQRWVRYEVEEIRRFGKLELKEKANDAVTLQCTK